MLKTTDHAKSKHEILCIVGYTKKKRSDICYIVNDTHFNTI
jgi:hypothetical protein